MFQSALRQATQRKGMLGSTPTLTWGKVVGRNSDSTFNVTLQNGSTYQHVQALSPFLGSQVGLSYQPVNDLTNPVQTADGTWDIPIASAGADLFCVIGFLEDNFRKPKILGFMNPAQSEMTLKTLGIYVNRHEGGTYHVTLPGALHDEHHWPDGSHFVIGDTQSHDMKTENENWNPPTQSNPAPLVFHHASGTTIEIDATGKVTIDPVNGVAIGSGSYGVGLGDLIQQAFNNHVHVSAAAGSDTSTPTVPMSGVTATKLTTD